MQKSETGTLTIIENFDEIKGDAELRWQSIANLDPSNSLLGLLLDNPLP